MPMREGAQVVNVPGPWRGLNELSDPKQIADNELSDSNNVVNKEGRIAPRPGYKKALTESLGRVMHLLISEKREFSSIKPVSSTGKIWWCDHSRQRITSMPQVGGVATDEFTLSTGFLYSLAIYANIDTLWYGTNGAFRIMKTLHTAPAAGTTLFTLTGGTNPAVAITQDNGASVLYWAQKDDGVYSGTFAGAGPSLVKPSGTLNGALLTGTAIDVRIDTGASPKLVYIVSETLGGNLSHIARCETNGNNYVRLINASSSQQTFGGIELDLVSSPQKMYYTIRTTASPSTTELWKADLDGTNQELVTGMSFSVAPGHLTLDNITSPTVWVFAVDGSPSSTGSQNKIYRILATGTPNPVSKFWLDRSLLGVNESSGETVRDIVWIQSHDSVLNESRFSVWLPSSNSIHSLYTGYSQGGDRDPSTWVVNDRDAVSSQGSAYRTKSGRASFRWTGAGINTATGGLLAADGEGVSVLNYTLSDSLIHIVVNNHTTGAGWWLHFDNKTDSVDTFGGDVIKIYRASTMSDINTAMRDNLAIIDGVECKRYVNSLESDVAADNYVIQIRFGGAWSGKRMGVVGFPPVLTTSDPDVTGASVLVSELIPGGASTGGEATTAGFTFSKSTPMLYARPAGLPTPKIVRKAIHGTTGGAWGVENKAVASTLDGVYSYRITYYSSLFNIESPPSEMMGEVGARYQYTVLTSSFSAALWAEALPDTAYFRDDDIYRAIDYIRIYRRRHGRTYSGSAGVDGDLDATGASDGWYLLKQKAITYVPTHTTGGNTEVYVDSGQDEPTSSLSPVMNKYPPSNANYVEIINDYAVYAGITPGDHNLWYSEFPKRGGQSDGELGFEYVANNSFIELPQLEMSDSPFTGLKAFGGRLMIGSQERVALANLNDATIGQATVQVLEGVKGFASNWCITEAIDLPGSLPVLIWPDKDGNIYSFDGSTTRVMNPQLRKTKKTLVRQYWNDNSYFSSNKDNWYYSTGLVDPENNRYILNTFVDSLTTGANSSIQLVYSLDTQSWSKWDIQSLGHWIMGREWLVAGGEARPIVVFTGPIAFLQKLVDGADDDGASFAWDYTTKEFTAGAPFLKKVWRDLAIMTRNNQNLGGGGAVGHTLDAVIDGVIRKTNNANSGDEKKMLSVSDRGYGMKLKVSGNQFNQTHHEELLSFVVDAEVVGGIRGMA